MNISSPAARTELPEPERRARAVRAVAACARDAGELTELLDMLGLEAGEVLPRPEAPTPVVVPAPRGRGIPISELTALLAAAGLTRQSA
ncbi:hypothetical protein ORV05_19845 [Amycolatopsis cynarae]|uniref:Uncharacterized protein n=1 Tax=Amycolatopsis cynarae TaxID=2995223 RepID=A0ABY7BDF7_9PSEU|nr:hypothetical protein [Amycolatopsis sp. HUAS 11-8]WAL70017.1 hypothetical protein ORV05_19845 [Amycolatopsis sp. HUAS 11-8]